MIVEDLELILGILLMFAGVWVFAWVCVGLVVLSYRYGIKIAMLVGNIGVRNTLKATE